MGAIPPPQQQRHVRHHGVVDALIAGADPIVVQAWHQSPSFRPQVEILANAMLHAVEGVATEALQAESDHRAKVAALARIPGPPSLPADVAERLIARDPRWHPLDEDGGDGL